MGRKIGKKLILLGMMMFLLSIAVFCLARQAPGDPLQSFYGDALERMADWEKEAARERLGLNDSISVQYARWLFRAFQGDLGLSLRYKRPSPACI